MRIKRISVFQVDLPLNIPTGSLGAASNSKSSDATLVKIETDTGQIGWGEGTPWGHTYVPAMGPGSVQASRHGTLYPRPRSAPRTRCGAGDGPIFARPPLRQKPD